jgi:hypothetical protein
MIYHFFIHLVIPTHRHSGAKRRGHWSGSSARHSSDAEHSELGRSLILAQFDGAFEVAKHGSAFQ